MNGFVRLAACAAVAGSVLTGLGAVRQDCDWPALSSLRAKVRRDLKERDRFASVGQAIDARLGDRRAVMRELRQGRLSLVEAAAAFRDLNERPGVPPSPFRVLFPGASDEEKLCRQVISWARSEREEETTHEAQERARRLEAELAAILKRRGAVRLPGDEPVPGATSRHTGPAGDK